LKKISERTKIGEFTQTVIDTLSLELEAGTPIYIGESNLRHMKLQHPKDFKKYGGKLERILANPDYVGKMDDGSVEYVKKFGLFIKIAVRITGGGDYYARTLYHVDDKFAKRLLQSGKWKSIKNF
jgi:hypothetical protein